MTQDEIIEMARQASKEWMKELPTPWETANQVPKGFLEIFAKLVDAKATAREREACAKVCETAREAIWEYHEEHLKAAACNVCTNIAQAIRSRGQA